MTMALGLSDIKAQMAGLVYRGCYRQRFPPSWRYAALSAGD